MTPHISRHAAALLLALAALAPSSTQAQVLGAGQVGLQLTEAITYRVLDPTPVGTRRTRRVRFGGTFSGGYCTVEEEYRADGHWWEVGGDCPDDADTRPTIWPLPRIPSPRYVPDPSVRDPYRDPTINWDIPPPAPDGGIGGEDSFR